jgi:ankyrin repeat protein
VAIKLITSETYIDNIRNFLPEKLNSKTPSLEKSKKILNQVINSPNFVFDRNNKSITDSIIILINTRPGRTLFKRLLKCNKPLKIEFNSNKKSRFTYSERTISTITINDSIRNQYHISVNPDGEKIFSPKNACISLVHELIHALHYFEEGPKFVVEKMTKNILDPDFDDLEEEETIMGKAGEATLCENLFRFLFGYPLRINHRGLTLTSEYTFTVSECATFGVLGSLKEVLSSDPSLLNLSQRRTGSKAIFEMTPLNAALKADQVEIVNYLFQVGADVNAQDESWGTALHVAALTNPDWVKVLLEKDAAPNLQNPKGFTALELALRRKHDAAAELLAPLSNLTEVNHRGRSILHRVLEGASPEGIRTLIRHGADISGKDLEENTPLMHFCHFACTDIEEAKQKFKLLLENDHLGLNAKNINGESALSQAVKKGHIWQVDALVKKGAKIPLHLEEKVEKFLEWYNDGVDEDIDGSKWTLYEVLEKPF